MFVFLNRLYRLVVVGLLAAGVWLVWSQREKARPALDHYQLWANAGYRVPDPLPMMTGRVERVLGEASVQITGPDGRPWNIGLQGLSGVPPEERAARLPARRFARETVSEMNDRLRGREIVLGVVLTNSNRTGLGFLYLTNHLVHEEWVASGRLALDPSQVRQLPLGEQYALRLADRSARRRGLGLWAPGGAGSADAGESGSGPESGEVVHDDP